MRRGTVFLPQLIQAAGAAQAAFEVIRERLSAQPGGQKGPKGAIVLATVKGDIHDIGKNIVKVLLENYGYPVIDLGKDVSGEEIIRAARENDADIIALSALMTTTMQRMREVVARVREENLKAKVMIGGAVITQEYADEIGADGYSADAAEAVKLAQRLVREKAAE